MIAAFSIWRSVNVALWTVLAIAYLVLAEPYRTRVALGVAAVAALLMLTPWLLRRGTRR